MRAVAEESKRRREEDEASKRAAEESKRRREDNKNKDKVTRWSKHRPEASGPTGPVSGPVSQAFRGPRNRPAAARGLLREQFFEQPGILVLVVRHLPRTTLRSLHTSECRHTHC